MLWLGLLLVVYLVLGIRAQRLRGSAHLLILIAAAVALGVVLLQPVRPQ